MIPRWILFFIVVLGVVVSGHVLAHAELLETVPANGEVLEQAPGQFVIRYTEPVSVIRIQLMNRERELIALGEVSNIDSELRFNPVLPLQQGQYLLSVRVLSLDAHPVSGSVGFAIGNLPAPLPEFTEVDKTSLVIARINRTIYLLAILASIGLVLFPLLFTLAEEIESKRQHYLNLTTSVGVVTAITGLGLWGVLLRETAPVTFLQAETWSLAMSTSLGTSFTLVVSGLLGIQIANMLDPNLPPGRFSALLGVVLVVAGFGASGHAASSGFLMTPVFVVHALMAGIWLGALWLIYRSVMIEPAIRVTAVLGQFSTRVTGVVSILLICAFVLTWYQLGGIVQFISSDYGNWLMLKLGLVCLVLILAALNRWRLTPAILDHGTKARQGLRRSIYIEGLLMVAVVAVTSILASTPPPGQGSQATSRTVMLTAGDQINLQLTMMPARAGENTIELVFSRDDKPITPLEVDIYWQQQEAAIEPLTQSAINTTEGEYRVDSLDLLVGGDWHIRVDALIDDFTRERFETKIRIED